MEWNVEKVKESLPDIMVKFGKDIVDARVRGRKNSFAGVYFQHNGKEISCEVAWPTIVNCLNNNKPVQF
jgi:hypothetical protein